jgi:hypothetical protein
MNNLFHKIHDGCHLKLEEVIAIWSEKYSDPKLDEACYLTRVFMKNNSTILTIANFSSKEEADSLINKVTNKLSVHSGE